MKLKFSSAIVGCICMLAAESLQPVVIIPGLVASQLQSRHSSLYPWEYVWISPKKAWAGLVDHILLLKYNSTTHKSSSASNYQVRSPNWGTTDSLEFITQCRIFEHLSKFQFFYQLVKQLKQMGYRENVTLFGAPYDWRFAPNTMNTFFRKLTDLIENAAKKNGGAPVTIICHSMGCTHTHYLLTRQTEAWKKKFVSRLIAASPAFGGSVQILQFMSAGWKPVGSFWIKIQELFEQVFLLSNAKSWPSFHYLMPPVELWKADETLVKIGPKEYSISNIKEFYSLPALGIANLYQLYDEVKDLSNFDKGNGVETHVVHGKNVKTLERLEFAEQDFPFLITNPIYGDGDGTVNIRSLRVPFTHWDKSTQNVTETVLDGVGHVDLIRTKRFIEIVVELLGGVDVKQEGKVVTAAFAQMKIDSVCMSLIIVNVWC